MKNIIIFFCDINGTIDGVLKNSYNDYKKFSELLITLQKEKGADNILFSLVSTENKHIVYQQSTTISKILDKSIIMGKQFFENGYIQNDITNPSTIGKIYQMITYLEELSKTYIINKIYLADDSEMIHEMLSDILEIKNIHSLESIIPANKTGLSEVNDIIKNRLLNQNTSLKKEGI